MSQHLANIATSCKYLNILQASHLPATILHKSQHPANILQTSRHPKNVPTSCKQLKISQTPTSQHLANASASRKRCKILQKICMISTPEPCKPCTILYLNIFQTSQHPPNILQTSQHPANISTPGKACNILQTSCKSLNILQILRHLVENRHLNILQLQMSQHLDLWLVEGGSID